MMNRMLCRFRRAFFLTGLFVSGVLSTWAEAKVVRVEIESRTPVVEGRAFERSGPYEKIRGKIYLELDPDHSANQLIVDLNLAKRNQRGRVEFATDFELHKPVDPGRGNHRLVYFVNNRGNRASVRGAFHNGGGENWLYRTGWSFLWCGWNVDVVPSDTRLNIYGPVVQEKGRTITGKIYAELCASKPDPVFSMPFYWGGSVAYPVVNLEQN
jgi:hypothetical protein